MAISASEISEVIKQRLRDFDGQMVSADVGRIVTVGDGIAQIYGLTGAMASELLQFPGDVYGLALNLEEDQVRAVIMGERSWGKGSVQNIIELEHGKSALKLTTAAYRRPSGKNIHRFPDAKDKDEWGVMPDLGLHE